MLPETPEPIQKACSTMCINWLKPQATHCQGEPSSRGHTEAVLTPLLGARLLLASWHFSWLPGTFPMLPNGHAAISQLPWTGKPDKTKVPIGDTSQFTEC